MPCAKALFDKCNCRKYCRGFAGIRTAICGISIHNETKTLISQNFISVLAQCFPRSNDLHVTHEGDAFDQRKWRFKFGFNKGNATHIPHTLCALHDVIPLRGTFCAKTGCDCVQSFFARKISKLNVAAICKAIIKRWTY